MHITTSNGSTVLVYCDMERTTVKEREAGLECNAIPCQHATTLRYICTCPQELELQHDTQLNYMSCSLTHCTPVCTTCSLGMCNKAPIIMAHLIYILLSKNIRHAVMIMFRRWPSLMYKKSRHQHMNSLIVRQSSVRGQPLIKCIIKQVKLSAEQAIT